MIARGRAALLLTLVLLGSALGSVACASAAGTEASARLITVRGVGRVAVKPDVALVRVGAEQRAPALADATADVARRMTAVLAQVKGLGVEDKDITTVAYTIDPVPAPRRTDEDPVRIVAYRAANVVQLRVRDLGAVGRLLDAAVRAGANTVSSLHFTVDDPTRPESEARRLAVRAAAARARELADAGGVKLGDLALLSETGGPVPRPHLERAVGPAFAAAPMAAGPVESGQLEIVVTVEAQYRIAP